MSTSPDIQDSMAGLRLSDGQGAPLGTDPVAESSKDDESATGCIAAAPETSCTLETMIATALQGAKEGNNYQNWFNQRSKPFDLIENAFKDQGLPNFFCDEWLDIGVKSQIKNPGEHYLATHVSLPEATLIVDDAWGGAPASDTSNVKQLFTIAPVIGHEEKHFDIPVPYEEDRKSIRIHIGSTGLSGWVEDWKSKNEGEGVEDRYDEDQLRLREDWKTKNEGEGVEDRYDEDQLRLREDWKSKNEGEGVEDRYDEDQLRLREDWKTKNEVEGVEDRYDEDQLRLREDWKTKNEVEGVEDRYDEDQLRLRDSGDSWVGWTAIEGLEQRELVTNVRATDTEGKSQSDYGWVRPKPFSAWFGTDTQDARQRALHNIDNPDVKVGFEARLYTLYTPGKQAHTIDSTAGNSSDNRWLRPKPFSAGFGTDTQDARQRALHNIDNPDVKVGFEARLYTLYTPGKEAHTELDTEADPTAATSSDN